MLTMLKLPIRCRVATTTLHGGSVGGLGKRQTGGASRVGELEVVDKPGRCMVEGVTDLILNSIGQRGKQQRYCRREAA